jgi:hypothetical protein
MGRRCYNAALGRPVSRSAAVPAIGDYDARVQRPSPDEIRRAGKALLLGVLLGLVLLLLVRRSRRR